MWEKIKRPLLILGLVLVTVAIGYALYYFFARSRVITNPPSPGQLPGSTSTTGNLPGSGDRIPVTGQTTTAPGTLPTAGNLAPLQPSYYQAKPVNQLTTAPVTYTSLNGANGNLRYYDKNSGKFYKILPDGSVKTLSDTVFYNVQKTTWANSNDKAILEYPDRSKIIYNFDTQKQVTLPKHWEDFSFSPDSKEIVAKSVGYSPENRWLMSFNDDGTGSKVIEEMGENQDKVTVSWSPSRQTVAFSQTGAAQGLYRKEILLVGQNHENFKSLLVEGLGFESQWSPTGKKILYSVYSQDSNYLPELWVSGAYGDDIGAGRANLKINTWSNKCVFADDVTLYCGVPRSMPQGAGIQPAIVAGTADDLYRIDLKSGLKTTIQTGGDYEINGISYDTATKRLLFTDKTQSGVFEVKL